MEIGVALAVRVRRHVHRYAVQVHAHVGPVVGVEPAQEDLVGLPSPLVLRQNQPGHGAQDVLRRHARPEQEVPLAHRARAGSGQRAFGLHVGLEDGLRRSRGGADRLAQRRRRFGQLEVDLVVELGGDRLPVAGRRLEAQLARRLQRRLVEPVAGSLDDPSGGHAPVGAHHDPHHHRSGLARKARLLREFRLGPLHHLGRDEPRRRLRQGRVGKRSGRAARGCARTRAHSGLRR